MLLSRFLPYRYCAIRHFCFARVGYSALVAVKYRRRIRVLSECCTSFDKSELASKHIRSTKYKIKEQIDILSSSDRYM